MYCDAIVKICLLTSERSKSLKLGVYDLFWNKKDNFIKGNEKSKPKYIDEMVTIAKTIAQHFGQVRGRFI